MTPTLLKETPSLPLELWDVTITHLREDRGTLSDCSLVCRSWEPMARRHLFETVAVLGPQDRCRLLLCDPSSTVLPYVHKLLLMKRDQPHVAWVEDLLPQVRANDLTALRTLWLSNVRWDGLSAASRTSLIHLCRWLTQIGLISKWPDHDARCPFAVELLGASPSLQRFALRCMHEDNHWQSPAQPLDIAPYSHMSTKAAPHLRTLEISADVGPLLTVLHTVFPVLHLQELSLGPLYEGTGSLVLSFLRSCAETLVCLSLSFKMFNETTRVLCRWRCLVLNGARDVLHWSPSKTHPGHSAPDYLEESGTPQHHGLASHICAQ
ncbi:uncharacterized protein C8Q71DRAFT_315979 [Rhodofomes roseus]|uniref:F-box domain-containing protein n=1 Tax=Rhodofomes roseus TaxID=34475 RepID=A0ABQ8K2L3_9APHY|nr:uncharacterized protein C8Q71DRAFT_315979 [Rhodofomes roseus]KAH9830965.1 hypothetical protein C8Q71DRAFT_315979 [Rhodofomes roseus]